MVRTVCIMEHGELSTYVAFARSYGVSFGKLARRHHLDTRISPGRAHHTLKAQLSHWNLHLTVNSAFKIKKYAL